MNASPESMREVDAAEQDLKFGPLRYDARQCLLLRGNEVVPLGRRALLLLAALLIRRGQVVGKDELLDAAWPGEAVEESNLSVQIAQLRKRIGADWIRTVERVGYSFVSETVGGGRWASATPVLAIYPSESAVVFSEHILAALTRFGSLRVVAPHHAEASRQDYRIEVTRDDDRDGVCISVRLVANDDGRYLWCEQFELPAKPPSSTRKALAGQIASIVEDRIERVERDRAPEEPASLADLYRLARRNLRSTRPGEFTTAIEMLERALAREPDNTMLLAALCEAFYHRIGMGWPALGADDVERCRDYALRGIAPPSVDGRLLAMFGAAIFRTLDPDWGHAILQRAAVLNPNSVVAIAYAATASMHWDKVDIAERMFRQALRLAPDHPAQAFVAGGISRIRLMQGRFADAVAWAKRACIANPDYGGAHWSLIAASALLGRNEDAHRYLGRFQTVQPGVTVAAVRSGQPTRGRMTATLEGLERAGLPVQ